MSYPNFYALLESPDETIQEEEISSPKGSDDFYEAIEKHASPLRKGARLGGQLAKGAVESSLFPYLATGALETQPAAKALEQRQDIFEEIAELGTKSRKGTISPDESERLQLLMEESKDPLKTLESTKPYAREGSLVQNLIKEATGVDLEPESGWETAASFLGSIKDPKKILQSFKNLSKLSPTSKAGRELLKKGKDIGMTDKMLTPFMQSSKRRNALGIFGMNTSRARKAIEEGRKHLDDVVYESIKNAPSKNLGLNYQQRKPFVDALSRIQSELKLNVNPNAEQKKLIKSIDTYKTFLKSGELSPAQLVATDRGVRDLVNWKEFDQGTHFASAIQKVLRGTLNKMSPELGKKYETYNALKSNFHKIKKFFPEDKIDAISNIKKWGPVMAGLAKSLSTGDLSSGLTRFMTIQGARALASEALINPALNNLLVKSLKIGAEPTKAATKRAVMQLTKDLEKYPDLYKEINDEFK